MKNIFKSIVLGSIVLFTSCASTVVSSNKAEEIDSKVQVGKTYIFKKTDGTRQKFRVLNVETDQITGENKEGDNFTLDRAEISKIKKSNTIGTVLLVAGGAAAAVVAPALYHNEPIL